MVQKQDRSGDGGNVLQSIDVWRDLALTAAAFGCIWVHSPEHLCKDVIPVVNYDILRRLKTSGKG